MCVRVEGKRCAVDREPRVTERCSNGLFTIFDAKHLLLWLHNAARTVHVIQYVISNVNNNTHRDKIRFSTSDVNTFALFVWKSFVYQKYNFLRAKNKCEYEYMQIENNLMYREWN